MTFKEDVIFSFESGANKLTLFRSEGSKLVVLTGAVAEYFSHPENQKHKDFDEHPIRFLKSFKKFGEDEVEGLFTKVKKTLIENELIG